MLSAVGVWPAGSVELVSRRRMRTNLKTIEERKRNEIFKNQERE